MSLHVLLPSGRRLLTRELAQGHLARVPEPAWREHSRALERRIELEPLADALTGLMQSTELHSPSLDALAAPALHRGLPLTRREASEPGIWRWLAIAWQPELVRHRWEYQSWTTMRDRFWRSGTRHDSNIYARLWWIAELTREGDDYSWTTRALASQPLAIGIFVRRFSHHPAAVRACIEVLEESPQAIIESCLRRLHARLGLFPLEARSEAELRADLLELLDLAWDEQARE